MSDAAEAKKLIMAICSARWRKRLNGNVADVQNIMFVDVKRGRTCVVCDDEGACMELPPEYAEYCRNMTFPEMACRCHGVLRHSPTPDVNMS